MRKLLAAHPEIQIIGEAADGLEAVAQIEQLRPDLLLLDVQMPGLNGFEVLRALPKEDELPLVIFATAHDEFALAAFETNALGYLLKPVSRERLAQAIERAQKLLGSQAQGEAEHQRIRSVVGSAVPSLQQLVARRRDRFVLLQFDQVLFLRVEDGILCVHTDGERYWNDCQINQVESLLPEPPFFRAHRSVIVNLRNVKEVAPSAKSTFLLILNDREETAIHVSERQSRKLRQLLHL